MRNKYLCCLAAVLSVAAFRASAQTTDDVLTLAQKGMTEEVLMATVERSNAAFNLSAADILKLKDAKVSDKVIAAMIRHKGPAGEPAVAQPKEALPAAPPVAAPVVKKEARADGILNIENVDDKVWSYSYEPDTRTIWIATPAADGRGNLGANGGVSVRMPAGAYKVRYNGQDSGPAVTVFSGEKSLLLLSRVDTAELEALYVSVFERGERKTGGRLVVLRQSAPARASKKASEARPQDPDDPQTRVVTRERVIEVPSTTVIYRDPYLPPVYTYPQYYVPVYPYYYYPSSHFNFGYSRYHPRSGFSIGIGIGH